MALILGGIAGLTINSKLDYNNPVNVEYTLSSSTNTNGVTYDSYIFIPGINGLCIFSVMLSNSLNWHGVRALSYKDKDEYITSTNGYGIWLFTDVSNINHSKMISFPVQDDVKYQIQITNGSYTLKYFNVIPLIQMK